MIEVIAGGVGVLVALAALIGVALDRAGRQSAWERIAAVRRSNAEQAHAAEQRRIALDAKAAELSIREHTLDVRERRLSAREASLEVRESERYGAQASPPDISV